MHTVALALSCSQVETSRYDICTEFATLQIHDMPSQAALKEVLFSCHDSMHALSRGLLDNPLANRPDLQQKITGFQKQFSAHIGLITTCSWNDLRQTRQSKLLEPVDGSSHSLMDFRKDANSLLNDLVFELGKEVGLPMVTWADYGTSGYKSDVDITLKIPGLLPNIEEVVLYKTLRDCLHTYVFGGLSGVQLDTECYYPHPAELDLSQYLHSHNARGRFVTGEKVSIVMQHYVCMQHMVQEYEKSKKRDLDAINDSGEREAMVLIYAQVEELMEDLRDKIAQKQRSGVSYKEARELVYIPMRMQLAAHCTRLQQQIETCCKKVINLDSAVEDANSTAESRLNGRGDKNELDELYLELQRQLIVVTLLQNEGTLSVAEGKSTLLEEGGQKHATVTRERKKSMTEFYRGNQEVVESVADLNPQLRRKASLPLTATLGSQYTSDELVRMLVGKDVETALKPIFPKPVCQTLLLAAYEESMQLQREILEGLSGGKDPAFVAIDAGKYALRVTRNLYFARKEFPAPMPHLQRQAEKLEKISASLEKCKRGVAISNHAAKELLTSALVTRLHKRGSYDETLVRSKIEQLFGNFDVNGPLFNSLLPQDDHLAFLSRKLKELKDFSIDVLLPGNAEILHILQAHAGFDSDSKEYKHLAEVHQEAAKLTVESLGLITNEKVREFLAEILQLGIELRNLAQANGRLMPSCADMVKGYCKI